jgi:PKD repeat protein
MMKLRKTILVALLLTISCNLFSKPVDLKTATRVAQNLITERAGTWQPVISSVEILSDQNIPLIYVNHLNNGKGFILISADDRVYPVLGYSFEDGFKIENMPENIRFWVNGYKKQILDAIQLNLPADSKASEAWDYYLQNNPVSTDNIAAVSPLVTTRWDQGCYYNAQCPVAAGGDCNRAWVGCVATTMAQIMKYHSYPAQGTGAHSYTHATYGVQTANFGTTTYNYSSMPVQLFSNNTATATLSYHCGVAVNMNYGVSGSGAQSSDARNALVNYFNYSTSAYFAQKFWFTDAAWEALIRTDLENGLPIMYSGFDGTYGHCFVLDGYQGTNHFHFNWGWSGWNNGYYYLANLNSGNGTFNTGQQAVMHITPPIPPVAQFTAATQNACETTPLQFTNTSTGFPTGFSWSFPGGNPATSSSANPVVTYSLPGTYDVKLKVTNPLGSDSITKTAWITVHPKPSKPLPTDTMICCNMSLTLNAANPGSTYSWNTGSTNQSVTIDSTGTGIGVKTVILNITSPYSCLTKDTMNITFAACTGMEESEAGVHKAWPNPSSGKIFIQISGESNKQHLSLFTADGRKISELNPNPVSSNTIEADLSVFPDGIYFLRIEESGKTDVIKINLLK